MLMMIIIMAGLLSHVAARGDPPAGAVAWWRVMLYGVTPAVVLAAAYFAVARLALRRLGKADTYRVLRRVERAALVYRILVVKLFFFHLYYLGLLDRLDAALRGVIVIPKLLMLVPTLAMLAWAWWCYYPLDRRLREASLVGRLDEGKPAPAIWTRWQFIAAQFRHQVAIVLAPLLIILVWDELLRATTPLLPEGWGSPVRLIAFVAGFFVVLLVSPMLITRIWDTVSLPAGEVRDTLVSLCRRHAVKVRDLLLWRTYGGMINAAVMGFAGPVRYILLTDALLEHLPGRAIEAVMAHEIAHVRKRHMIWLVVAASATWGVSFAIAMAAITAVVALLQLAFTEPPAWWADAWAHVGIEPAEALVGLAAIGALALWYLSFGWVSRRFERQADTFAVVHLSAAAGAAPSPRETIKARPTADDDARADDAPSSPPVLTFPSIAPTLTFSGAGEPMAMNSSSDREQPDTPPPGMTVINEAATEAMREALWHVADLNHIPIKRRSWRHGSIHWRREYLTTLVGQRADRLAIDRVVWRINAASILAIAALVALGWAMPEWVMF